MKALVITQTKLLKQIRRQMPRPTLVELDGKTKARRRRAKHIVSHTP